MQILSTKLAALGLSCCVLAGAAVLPSASASAESRPWYQTYMEAFDSKGFLTQVQSVKPDDTITRAQFASVVGRAAGLAEESSKIADYTDVSASNPYRADLAKALAAGYMNGTSDTTLAPDAPLTREDAAVMLTRLMKLEAPAEDALAKFSDSAAISAYARESAAAMSAAGYINGADGQFQPKKNLTLAEAVTILYNAQNALAGEAQNPGLEGHRFVLMNIPYAQFYAADAVNDIPVDAVSSATLNKTRSGTLVGGSYHVDSEGSDITGITFPVAVPDGADLSKCRQVTDADSIDITVTNRGSTSTTAYAGKDALFENESYAYYALNASPAYYKVLTVGEDGAFSFGETQGAAKALAGASAALSTESEYGDYQISVTGLPEIETVYAVTLSTREGGSYGLRHLENIWRNSELAWCTGFTDEVHGCPTSSGHYAAMMGQTIDQITYYTSEGIFTIAVDLYVPVKFEHTLEVAEAASDAGTAELTMTGFPEDYAPVYTVTDAAGAGRGAFTGDGKALAWTSASAGPNTLTVTDAKGKYAPCIADFLLTAGTAPAQAGEAMLVKAEGASDADFSCYLASIETVNVDGTGYAASGRGSVAVIGKDGRVDFSTSAFTELAGKTVKLTVTAAGFAGDLTLTVHVPENLPAAGDGNRSR